MSIVAPPTSEAMMSRLPRRTTTSDAGLPERENPDILIVDEGYESGDAHVVLGAQGQAHLRSDTFVLSKAQALFELKSKALSNSAAHPQWTAGLAALAARQRQEESRGGEGRGQGVETGQGVSYLGCWGKKEKIPGAPQSARVCVKPPHCW